MADVCSRCSERYPSHYYIVVGVSPAVCIRCWATLSLEERDRLVTARPAAPPRPTIRHCLRCETSMTRGELIHSVRTGSGMAACDVQWAITRSESRFLGLLSERVVDRALPVEAWRCAACGYTELSTPPDPPDNRERQADDEAPEPTRDDDDSTLL